MDEENAMDDEVQQTFPSESAFSGMSDENGREFGDTTASRVNQAWGNQSKLELFNVAQKTIVAKVLGLGEVEERLLSEEFGNWQKYLRGDKTVMLRAATKQQADRFLNKMWDRRLPLIAGKEYPMILRRDFYRAELRNPPYWVKFGVSGTVGGVKLPVGIPAEIPEGVQMRQAKLVRREDGWEVHMLIRKEVQEVTSESYLAIDMGTRNLATVVCTWDSRPRFYGGDLREIHAHYYKLRRTLAKKGAHGAIKKIGHREARKTDAILHAVSRAMIDDAAAHQAIIFIGNLRGLLEKKRGTGLGRRIMQGFPFWTFYHYLLYKAEWAGVRIVTLNEAYTSVLCHNCGRRGIRDGGRFRCEGCGHEYNADYNGAKNIMKRGMGYISMSGVASGTARTRQDEAPSSAPTNREPNWDASKAALSDAAKQET